MNNDKSLNPSNTQLVREIANKIFQIQIPLAKNLLSDLDHIYAYLIAGSNNDWWLIDTGWEDQETIQALEKAFELLHISITDISTILLSHSHPDHYGMAARIKRLSQNKAQVVMHHREAENIEFRYIKYAESEKMTEAFLAKHGVPPKELQLLGTASMPALDMVTVVLPDLLLSGGEILHTGVYDLEVIWTPGHSPGHICFYEPRTQFLFSGDNILPNITPNISSNILSGDNPMGEYINTLKGLTRLSVKEVHPGHEYSFKDFKGRIQQILEHHRVREDKIYKVITQHRCSAYDIASRLTWNVHDQTWDQFNPWTRRMALTEVVAHLDYMRAEGRVRKDIQDNLIFYSTL